MMSKTVCIVMINYRTPDITIEGVNSALKAINNESYIVVVDNDSKDGSFDVLSDYYKNNKNVVIIESEDNAGFSAGNNIGIKYAMKNKADFILLLNNDTEIDHNIINELISRADEKTVTVPKMYYFKEENKIWYAGGHINKFTGRMTHIGENEQDRGQYDKECYVDFATGCCMLIPMSVIMKIGLMDESYFMYVEDVDYSLNMVKHGINILYVPSAKLWHKVGSSSGNKSKLTVYYGNRGRFMLMNKYNFSITAKICLYNTRIILLIKGLLTNTNEKYIFRAWIDYKRGRTGKVEL